jgi:hypothetical protein
VTEEEWALIKPLAEAKVLAQAALTNWQQSNQPRDERLRIESQVAGVRLQAEFQAAERALDAALWQAKSYASGVYVFPDTDGGERADNG